MRRRGRSQAGLTCRPKECQRRRPALVVSDALEAVVRSPESTATRRHQGGASDAEVDGIRRPKPARSRRNGGRQETGIAIEARRRGLGQVGSAMSRTR